MNSAVEYRQRRASAARNHLQRMANSFVLEADMQMAAVANHLRDTLSDADAIALVDCLTAPEYDANTIASLVAESHKATRKDGPS